MPSLVDLQRLREHACRLTPDRALASLDEAESFLRDRGLLTRMADCSLPSLFGACHEEPYKPGGRGFAAWPRTKWPWAFELAARDGVHVVALHRGKGLYMTAGAAALADPLCRAELARAEAGELGEDATRVVGHLADAGPSLLEELLEELALGRPALRRVRSRLEPLGAVVSRAVIDERTTSELARWDQLFSPASGGLGDLLVAGVRAAVVAPEDEARGWFTWRAPTELVDELVTGGRLERPEAGWLSAPS